MDPHYYSVRKDAITRLPIELRTNHIAILGATTLEFGRFYSQTFWWALDNATGWVVEVVAQIMEEPEVDRYIGMNKKTVGDVRPELPLGKGQKGHAEVIYNGGVSELPQGAMLRPQCSLNLYQEGFFICLFNRTGNSRLLYTIFAHFFFNLARQRLWSAISRPTLASSEALLSLEDVQPGGAAEKRVAENTARQRRCLGSKRPLHRQQQVGEPTPDVVYPPKPALFSNMFFHHRFSLWMPYHMLAFLFLCSQTGYERRQLSTKLHCVSYQLFYPATLAIDKRVVAELRNCSLGNSCTRVYRKLKELHSTGYLEKVLYVHYHTVVEVFGSIPYTDSSKSGPSIQAGTFCRLAAVCVCGIIGPNPSSSSLRVTRSLQLSGTDLQGTSKTLPLRDSRRSGDGTLS
ncbi:hypothetical protein RRG08_040341 [Elysia crispata]|uniref:DUF6729 domain-containing protein n=1 Tax=Elysia crispata TaxID=231223 RepID=A0AAE1ATY9_9GAST|nr:hypothetical protein RRG08_040341 [Elysia crispata]